MQKHSLNILRQARTLFCPKSSYQISNFNKRGFSGITRSEHKTYIQKMMEKAKNKSDRVEMRLLSIHNRNQIRMSEQRTNPLGYSPLRSRIADRSKHYYSRAAYRGLNFIRRLKGKPRIEERVFAQPKPSFVRRNWVFISGVGIVTYMFLENVIESIKFVSSVQKN